MERLFVTADDRTGALEVAGSLADRRGRPVRMRALSVPSAGRDRGHGALAGPDSTGDVVVDLGSRHAHSSQVGELVAAALDRIASPVTAHKFDSTLRGNWAAELVELHRRSGKRVLVVPALPSAGRVCRSGVVLVDGVPVSESALGHDRRRPVASSRPAEHLAAAGVTSVASIVDGGHLASWMAGGGPSFAVVDAADDGDLQRVADAWRPHRSGILLAGTSEAIACGVGHADPPLGGTGGRRVAPHAEGVLVVCGSLHPVARRQLAELAAHFGDDERVAIVATLPPWPPTTAVDDEAAAAAGGELAERAWRALQARPERAVVVLGGDTAQAMLGDDVLEVEGMLMAGVAWSYDLTRNLQVATRAGGFGDDRALVDLVARLLEHGEGASAVDWPGTLV